MRYINSRNITFLLMDGVYIYMLDNLLFVVYILVGIFILYSYTSIQDCISYSLKSTGDFKRAIS